MMQPILEKLARFLTDDPDGLSGETCIILPNRRAGLFLQRHLSTHMRQVGWMPHIYAITEYMNELSSLAPSDPTETLFTLYDIYRETKAQSGSLDEFYYWGEIMLHDFDEIDKYMVDPEMLFRNLEDLKEIEEPLAGLEESQISFIRQFWEGFHQGQATPEKEQFLEIWKLLPILYGRHRENLRNEGEGSPGMQYREIAGMIENGMLARPRWDRIIVAGFNALNACEQRIFKWLKNHGAVFFWDYDHLYVDDPAQEAGRFIRDNLAAFPPPLDLESFRGMEKDKEIRIFELPTDVLQAKTVHRILEQDGREGISECTDTAVVLCDEELLMPVLMSLPESMGEINVTMGYPLSITPVLGFVDALFRLQHNIRKCPDGSEVFYYKDVKSILLHPYMEHSGDGMAHPLLDLIASGNLIQVERSRFETAFEKMIFRSMDGSKGLIRYFRDIFFHILEALAADDNKVLPALHREFVFALLIHLNKLETLLESRPEIPLPVLEKLFRKLLAAFRVPFEGEPLSGLQVMGILETRLLDFKHVILLSMNEEVMPASHFRQSYIPFSLRLAFGMPGREDMDAMYAYYFNRILQRAEKVDLLYNGTSEGIRTGEMSRYLRQLIFLRGIRVIRPGMEVMAREVPELVIGHTEEIDALLNRYAVDAEGNKYLSPSAINAYVDCSLKFYLRYLAGIGEPDEVLEEIDAAGFGTVVHDSIKLLYEEIAGEDNGMISRKSLQQLLGSGRIEEVLKTAFVKYHFKGRKSAVIEGRNIIIIKVMIRYLKKIIQTDLGIAPFTLVSTEKTYTRELELNTGNRETTIRIGGKIDRVDRAGGLLRVIDYKTGNASHGFSTLGSLFDGTLAARNGAALQTLLYTWLVGKVHPGEQLAPGLYVMKSLYEERFDPLLTIGIRSEKHRIDSFSAYEEDYIKLLRNTLNKMFDSGIPFAQTENESKCRTCDFAILCNRSVID
ncbi:MAG: PD-(D/E)XK nuclease family protein [Bacteroidota bacterium]